MQKQNILDILRQNEEPFHQLGVKSLAVFGSVARGDDDSSSDIDLLIETEPGVGFFGLARIKAFAESILGAEVDLVPRRCIHPALRGRILSEAVGVL